MGKLSSMKCLAFVRYVAVAVASTAAPWVAAEQRSGSMQVNASVSPAASFSFEYESPPMVITQADIEKGFVEVVFKSKLTMRGPQTRPDARPTFMVDVAARPDLFSSLGISSAKAEQKVSTEDTSDPLARTQVSEFRYRFELAKNVRPGRYEAPLSFTIEL